MQSSSIIGTTGHHDSIQAAGLSEKSRQPADDEEKGKWAADQGHRHESRKQTYSGLVLLWVSFQATGVIYGDIGTSLLYVFSSTFETQPSWDDLVGALSIIIWSLTMIVTVKYALIVLRADDDGQGGTFALYTLLSRYIRITRQDPHAVEMPGMRRYSSGDMQPAGRGLRTFLESSLGAQLALKVVGLAGVSLTVADGVLGPAQSVLGAVQGLKVVDPTLSTPVIVGVSCAILAALFCLQPFGTSKLGTGFAPVVTVWLLFNLCSGLYNIVMYDYTVLRAFSPYFAFSYLMRNGNAGWQSLGGLVLAFTGVESLFADMGAFSKRAIQISWLGLVYPCLLMAYVGQAAYISQDASQTAFTNPFFFTIPPGTFYFGMVIAVLASIVASQALITSTFQLLGQVMRMSYFPRIRVVHTSNRFHDQIYIPVANWLLLLGTVVLTIVYNNTTSLGDAYGVCVTMVTLITTFMVSLVALLIWRLTPWLVVPLFFVFASLDGIFLSAVLAKVPDGGWFTIVLAVILSSVFVVWRYGKEAQWTAEAAEPLTAPSILKFSAGADEDGGDGDNDNDDNEEDSSNSGSSQRQRQQQQSKGGRPRRRGEATGSESQATDAAGFAVRLRTAGATPVSTVPGLGIFFDKVGNPAQLPHSFTHFVRKFAARPSVIVFFHMRALHVPTVPAQDRFVVSRFESWAGADAKGGSGGAWGPSLLPDAYVVVLRHGYAEDVLRPGLARDVIAALQLAIMTASATAPATPAGGAAPPLLTPLSQPSQPSQPSPPPPPPAVVGARAAEAESMARELERQEDLALAELQKACRAQTVFVLGKEAMRVNKEGAGRGRAWNVVRRGLLEVFLWIRDNTRTKLADLDIDVDKVIEVGFVKEI
ncbi:hypothetical protein GGTG_14185 [Gaeumannomyces tritici R3-111a-1]|uniref:Potassium uptake protein n=1 Tax=Gaeumannomyces tritici (strain R3-111a-1) TaxID=644352 RepID=J3PKW3_GAET3|nr:hypothetical protein GGTG_14185 [Gaeumannomyces tritici R3-111a-1]EJT68235.1 hypothetical protein GGTG_14185 [Gaeumannomyces tritici R3-111a-1]